MGRRWSIVLRGKLESRPCSQRLTDVLLLSKDRSQATDLGTKRSTDMLGCIRDKILNATHDVVEEHVTIHKSTEAGNLASNSGSYLGLVVLEKFYECGNEVSRNNLLVYRLSNL